MTSMHGRDKKKAAMALPAHTVVRLRDVEVLCAPGAVEAFRKGAISAAAAVITDVIYRRGGAGSEPASADEVAAALPGVPPSARIVEVLSKGTYSVSAVERAEEVKVAMRQMVEYLHRNYVNPDTKAPYSTALIASALGDIKYTPVLHQSPDRQMEKVFRPLNDILRLKLAEGSEAALLAEAAADAATALRSCGKGMGKGKGKGGRGAGGKAASGGATASSSSGTTTAGATGMASTPAVGDGTVRSAPPRRK